MTADRLRRYRFSTDAQWNACLFVQTDRISHSGGTELRAFAPYERSATLYESPGARAPVVTRAGDILWLDEKGNLHRLSKCDGTPETCPPPFTVGGYTRIVATTSALWVQGKPPESILGYEEPTLSRLVAVEIPGATVVDIASDGRDAVWALVERDGKWQSVRVDRAGHITATVPLDGISHATHFAFLRRAQRFVVLAGKPEHPCHEQRPFQRLYWFSEEGGIPGFSVAVAGMRPCFVADVLGTDLRDRVFLAGADGREFGGQAFVLIFDGEGNALGEVPLDPMDVPASGIAATRDSLLLTGPRGLLRFTAAQTVPHDAGQVRCTIVTPVLQSPDREDRRRWLRAEATTILPEGSTLEIAVAATDDAAVRDRLKAIAADRSLSASRRVAELLNDPDVSRSKTEIHGSDAYGKALQTLSAKLFNISQQYLFVSVTLSTAPGGRLPRLTELAVLYPGHTLMQHLPAIYQAEEEQPDSFFRGLVGVLEATTQGLDRRISSMGSRIHPSTAPEPWLNFIARWLGVPWDDALGADQKRAIVMRASDLAKGRGTRAGLEALLESIIPGRPPRFRVTDATADVGFAIVGGEACSGSQLPAMLGGSTQWSAELDSRAVLGHMRLPCPGQQDDGAWQLAGKVRIEVAATAAERKKWEPWLLSLISEMVPLTARIELRWVSAQALRSHRLDGTLTLDSAPPAHLGTDAVTGLARLPERGARLSGSGPQISTRLR